MLLPPHDNPTKRGGHERRPGQVVPMAGVAPRQRHWPTRHSVSRPRMMVSDGQRLGRPGPPVVKALWG